MHNKIVHAPLENPQHLLDIGCGTGIVTRYLSTTFPSATSIYGIDISPVPAIQSNTPSNITYIQGDVKKIAKSDKRLSPCSLDYAFSRLLVWGMTDWPGYLRDTVVPMLKPGAWAEVHDLYYVCYKHGEVYGADWKWLKAMREGARRKGLDMDCGRNMTSYMREAGLREVSQRRYGIPTGTWDVARRPETRRIGTHHARELAVPYRDLIPKAVEGLGLSEEEVRELVDECEECLKEEEGKEWFIYVTIGRRPLA